MEEDEVVVVVVVVVVVELVMDGTTNNGEASLGKISLSVGRRCRRGGRFSKYELLAGHNAVAIL